MDVYTHRIRQAIGALTATLGGVDALVFTAGVGENSAEVRAAVCKGLDCMGLTIDAERNEHSKPDADIARGDSRGRILVIATREDITMWREVVDVLNQESSSNRP
jgi:acetate kinase